MSETQFVGRNPAPAVAVVAVDRTTIRGTGTQWDPLHSASAPGSFTYVATTAEVIGDLNLGKAMRVDDVTTPPSVAFSEAALLGAPQVSGLVIAAENIESGAIVTIQYDGIVTLTTAEWDAITGESGGLTVSATYYLSSTVPGDLTKTAPSAPATYTTQVGFALTATELQLQIGEPVAH